MRGPHDIKAKDVVVTNNGTDTLRVFTATDGSWDRLCWRVLAQSEITELPESSWVLRLSDKVRGTVDEYRSVVFDNGEVFSLDTLQKTGSMLVLLCLPKATPTYGALEKLLDDLGELLNEPPETWQSILRDLEDAVEAFYSAVKDIPRGENGEYVFRNIIEQAANEL